MYRPELSWTYRKSSIAAEYPIVSKPVSVDRHSLATVHRRKKISEESGVCWICHQNNNEDDDDDDDNNDY